MQYVAHSDKIHRIKNDIIILRDLELLSCNPVSPHDASNHHFPSLKNDLISYTQARGFRTKMSMELFYYF